MRSTSSVATFVFSATTIWISLLVSIRFSPSILTFCFALTKRIFPLDFFSTLNGVTSSLCIPLRWPATRQCYPNALLGARGRRGLWTLNHKQRKRFELFHICFGFLPMMYLNRQRNSQKYTKSFKFLNSLLLIGLTILRVALNRFVSRIEGSCTCILNTLVAVKEDY